MFQPQSMEWYGENRSCFRGTDWVVTGLCGMEGVATALRDQTRQSNHQ